MKPRVHLARGRQRARGMIWAELAVCIPILALLLTLTMAGFVSYYRVRSEAFARQAAAWAAAAQMQRYQAGAPLDSTPPAGVLPPEVALKTTTQPAEGDWQGFQLVTVTATYEIGVGRSVRERVSGYIRTEAKP